MLQQAGRSDIEVESAGIADYHVGESPDSRTVAAAKRKGVTLTSRAQHFQKHHLDHYDLVLAMDETHFKHVTKLGAGKAKVVLFRPYDPLCAGEKEVPDPYYGSTQSFDDVFDMCWRGCEALLKTL